MVLAFEVNLTKTLDCLRRDDGGLVDDDALFDQVFDAPLASGNRRMHLCGQFFQRNVHACLENDEDIAVEFVQSISDGL